LDLHVKLLNRRPGVLVLNPKHKGCICLPQSIIVLTFLRRTELNRVLPWKDFYKRMCFWECITACDLATPRTRPARPHYPNCPSYCILRTQVPRKVIPISGLSIYSEREDSTSTCDISTSRTYT